MAPDAALTLSQSTEVEIPFDELLAPATKRCEASATRNPEIPDRPFSLAVERIPTVAGDTVPPAGGSEILMSSFPTRIQPTPSIRAGPDIDRAEAPDRGRRVGSDKVSATESFAASKYCSESARPELDTTKEPLPYGTGTDRA
jgi:hypothetical protein